MGIGITPKMIYKTFSYHRKGRLATGECFMSKKAWLKKFLNSLYFSSSS